MSLGVYVSFGIRRDEASRPLLGLRCTQPWEYVFIRATGDIAPCCAVFGSDHGAVMGNIIREDFRSIWQGDRYREFRITSASGANDLCQICTLY